MKALYLESASLEVSMNLTEILDIEGGIYALAGATGFGLLPVQIEWDTGAGDGQVFRSSRVPYRDIDIPLYIEAATNEDLGDVLATLARMLDGEVTLRIIDNFYDEWTLKAYRTGGGDFAYGEDNDSTSVSLVVSLRAGQPYWERVRTEHIEHDYTAISQPITMANEGSAVSYPVITVHGPTLGVTLTGSGGEIVRYLGFIWPDEAITFDMGAGTVYDQNGVNRYSELDAAPNFFGLPPGSSSIDVTVLQSGSEFDAASVITNTNFVKQPSFGNVNGNAFSNSSWNASEYRLSDGGVLGVVHFSVAGGTPAIGPGTVTDRRYLYAAATSTTAYGYAYNLCQTLTGLTVGETYYYSFSAVGYNPVQPVYFRLYSGSVIAHHTSPMPSGQTEYASASVTPPNIEQVTWSGSFVAVSDTAIIQASFNPSTTTQQAYVGKPYVGKVAPYFDGDTPDTAEFDYAWSPDPTGLSTRSTLIPPGPEPSYVRAQMWPRKHVVV